MSRRTWHKRGAIVMSRFSSAVTLDPASSNGVVTAAFYCSLQCVEAYLASVEQHARNHHERFTLLARSDAPTEIYNAFKRLQDWSNQARYHLRIYDAEFVEQAVMSSLQQVTDWCNL